MTIGEKIQKLRTDAGLSQTQLADALTVSRSAIAKWENDNGVPDVENLKALAAFFQTDVDALLDDTKEIPIPNAADNENPTPRPDTYCGKSCEDCTYREELECPGCKAGPGKRFQESCEIAKCARSRTIFQCERCGNQLYCTHIKRAEKIPRIFQEQREQERLRKERLDRQAPFFGKWMMVLFCLLIAGEIAGILTIDYFEYIGNVVAIGHILNLLIVIAYGCILIRMSRQMQCFYVAGIALIIADLIPNTINLLSGNDPGIWTIILLIPALICALVAKYNEFTGYASIVRDLNDGIAASWMTLWKIQIWSSGISLAATVLLVILQDFGLLVIGICRVLQVVVGILQILYLYKTAKVFKNYCA